MPRPRRSEHRREELLDLGVELLRARGYHGTGIQQVVGRAGVPKGSFYNYFASKEAFGAAVVERYTALFQAGLEELRGASRRAPRRALVAFFEGLVERFVQNGARGGCLVGNLGAELEGEEEALSAALRTTMSAWREVFSDVVARAQERGEVASTRPAAVLADFLINAWEGALIRMKIEGSVEPLRECLDIVFEDLLAPGSTPDRRGERD